MLRLGIAKECARFVLPLAVPTKIYMTGSVRSWIHYITLRSANGTQKEHMEIANLCKQHFICQFPIVAKALDWCPDDCGCPEDWDDLQPCLRID
jgi:thymidylate synthase (FAD)